jgi:thiosulfate dehydrogenase [quinone] large subunit
VEVVTMAASSQAAAQPSPRSITLDARGGVWVPRGAAYSAALLRIGLGLVYLWAFIEQGFGVSYSNTAAPAAGQPTSYGWHFTYDASDGWISSGFSHSPTAGYIGNTHGPLAFIPKDLPTGLDDLGWMVAIAGLGVALTLGIGMYVAGIGGFLLNILLWFSTFPPNGNPIIDGTHTIYALLLLLLMFLHAGNQWGLGRWWSRHTPRLLN